MQKMCMAPTEQKMCLAPTEDPQGTQTTKSLAHTPEPANIHPAKGEQKVGGTNCRRTNSNGWLKMCTAPIFGTTFTPKHPKTQKPRAHARARKHPPRKGGWHQLAKNQLQWLVKNVHGTDFGHHIHPKAPKNPKASRTHQSPQTSTQKRRMAPIGEEPTPMGG
jgi:hypothetical protein